MLLSNYFQYGRVFDDCFLPPPLLIVIALRFQESDIVYAVTIFGDFGN